MAVTVAANAYAEVATGGAYTPILLISGVADLAIQANDVIQDWQNL